MLFNKDKTVSVGSVDELKTLFTDEKIDELPGKIKINDVEYQVSSGSDWDLKSALEKNLKGTLTYQVISEENNKTLFNKNKEEDTNITTYVVFVWNFSPQLHLVPADVLYVTDKYPSSESLTTESKDNNENVLGDTVNITLIGFNNDVPIKAKVDTGATLCSLHADNIQVVPSATEVTPTAVAFTFNGKKYKMNLVDDQAVQTADNGIEYRPVVKFGVKR